MARAATDLEIDISDEEIQDIAELENGEVVVDLDGNPAIDVEIEITDMQVFDANLAEGLNEQTLNDLSRKVLDFVQEDEMSRADWRRDYARG